MIKSLKQVKQSTNNDESEYCLKVLIEAGGCSGFQYNFEIIPEEMIDESRDYEFI